MEKYTSLEEAVKLVRNETGVYDKIEHLVGVFVSKRKLDKAKSIESYVLPITKLNTLIDAGRIRTQSIDGNVKYSVYDLAKYFIQQEIIADKFYYFTDFFDMNNSKVSKGVSKLYHQIIEKLSLLGLIEVIQLSPIDSLGKKDKFITRLHTDIFFNDYISLANISKEKGLSFETLHSKLSDIEGKISILNIGKYYSYRFVKKKDFENYMSNFLTYSQELISEKSLGNSLGLTQKAIQKVLKVFNIQPQTVVGEIKNQKSKRNFQGRKFYTPDTLPLLKREQKREWVFYTENYYTSKEVDELVENELHINSPSREVFSNSYFEKYQNDNLSKISVPEIIRIEKDGRNFKGVNFLYRKEIIDNFIQDMKFERDYVAISETMLAQPLIAYQETIKHCNVTFPEGSKETEDLWNSFVKITLERRDNERTLLRAIRDHVQTAKFLTKLLSATKKDVAFLTNKEIKVAVFNKNVKVYQQAIMYSFLYNLQSYYVGQGKKVLYKLDVFENPARPENQSRIKEVYSKDEYGAFLDYVNQIEKHKLKAIEDIEVLLEGNRKKYLGYASTWLYVLIHLNNKWRRYEVTIFPPLGDDISNTNIIKRFNMNYKAALNYLKKHDLEKSDVEYIANKLKAFITIHNKNKGERDFTWTETTSLALATAIILCEIRCKLDNFETEYLIDFHSKSRQLPERNERYFFSDFEEKNLNFKSLKMNATLSSLGFQTSRRLGNEAVMDVIRSFRNHNLDQSTNIYLSISEERLTEISNNLFNSGPFGFVHTQLSNIFEGKDNIDKNLISVDKANFSKEISRIFGDWLKIEELVRTFKLLSNNEIIAKDLINSMSEEELIELNKKMKMGLNHAKDEGFMCVFSDCVYKQLEQDCISCPFMTMNFHTLTVLARDFSKLIIQCELKFQRLNEVGNFTKYKEDVPDAERLRLTRLLAIYTYRLKEAVAEFGEDVVSMFFKDGLNTARESLRAIPSVSRYKKMLVEIDKISWEE
ncbi:hypothetical protein J7E38_00090 [Bacillus sp. ISL-35]|uniref:hypothetical protein n=1 Tax=Bacillus sp. ISL-35 TaxID=2819122 RepID=UPI001BE7DFC7|nr:hypothetical protein [Bacillus sp. ISL-35]MBT2677374.1 hypothetical protein [Bacillus sp. ISL-35]MBT2702239.1 hypothetical protein [Chryseobacterium sp. ISL-80]